MSPIDAVGAVRKTAFHFSSTELLISLKILQQCTVFAFYCILQREDLMYKHLWGYGVDGSLRFVARCRKCIVASHNCWNVNCPARGGRFVQLFLVGYAWTSQK